MHHFFVILPHRISQLVLAIALLGTTPLQGSAQTDTAIQHFTLHQLSQQSIASMPPFTGGSLTIASASMGLSMITLSLKMSAAREEEPGRKQKAEALISRLQKKADSLFYYANENEKAFTRYLAARRLHDSTDALKKAKETMHQRTLRETTQLPLRGARLIVNSLTTVNSALPYCRKAMLVDLSAGIIQLRACLDALLLQAQSNTALLSATDRTRVEKERLALQSQGRLTASLLLNNIQNKVQGQ